MESEWDEYGHDVTGEDDWVEPMDDLFTEALALARAGNWATATEALRRLLMAFQLEEEEGVFGGEEVARIPFEPWAGIESRRWTFLVLAMAALEGRQPPASTQLYQAWEKLARILPGYDRRLEALLPASTPSLGLADLVQWKVLRKPLDSRGWAGIRRQLGAIAQGWATDVLKVSQRGGYPEAARWLAVAVEIHRLCGEPHQAESLPRSILEAFPRHRAFRQDWEVYASTSQCPPLVRAHPAHLTRFFLRQFVMAYPTDRVHRRSGKRNPGFRPWLAGGHALEYPMAKTRSGIRNQSGNHPPA